MDGEPVAVEGPHEDLVGHGTACAAIIRLLAPEAEIYSVRVLGANLQGHAAGRSTPGSSGPSSRHAGR